jgi:hypothetical protein
MTDLRHIITPGAIGSDIGRQPHQSRSSGWGYSNAPRVLIEIDRVTNGYVLAVGDERMIAKDLEELQQHVLAQVVSRLVLDEAK